MPPGRRLNEFDEGPYGLPGERNPNGRIPLIFVWRKPLARRVVEKKAYADDVDKKTPFAKIEVRSANCTTKAKGGHSK